MIEEAIKKKMQKLGERFLENVKEELKVPAIALTNKHRAVVRNWIHAPTFAYRITVKETSVKVIVFPKGRYKNLYLWTDRGTAAHMIEPKNAKMLSFQKGGRPKTRPTAKYGGGRKPRGKFIFTTRVNHPGTAPRLFSQTFTELFRPDFMDAIKTAFKNTKRELKG